MKGNYIIKLLKSKEKELSEYVRLRKGRAELICIITLPLANTLAVTTKQALDKKKRLAGKGTLAPVGTFGTVA